MSGPEFYVDDERVTREQYDHARVRFAIYGNTYEERWPNEDGWACYRTIDPRRITANADGSYTIRPVGTT